MITAVNPSRATRGVFAVGSADLGGERPSILRPGATRAMSRAQLVLCVACLAVALAQRVPVAHAAAAPCRNNAATAGKPQPPCTKTATGTPSATATATGPSATATATVTTTAGTSSLSATVSTTVSATVSATLTAPTATVSQGTLSLTQTVSVSETATETVTVTLTETVTRPKPETKAPTLKPAPTLAAPTVPVAPPLPAWAIGMLVVAAILIFGAVVYAAKRQRNRANAQEGKYKEKEEQRFEERMKKLRKDIGPAARV